MQNSFNQTHVQRLQAAAAARLNNFHGPKRQLLGSKAVPAPAWKANVANGTSGVNGGVAGKGKEVGSKILLSRLPVDVTALEVEVSLWLCVQEGCTDSPRVCGRDRRSCSRKRLDH